MEGALRPHNDDFMHRLRRKQHCTALVGDGIVALHEASVPPGHMAGPIFWRDLWLSSSCMNTVRWWRHGAHELKTSVEEVSVWPEQAPAILVLQCLLGMQEDMLLGRPDTISNWFQN